MAYSENIADRIRKCLANIPKITEKKMMGGLTLLLNNKIVLMDISGRLMKTLSFYRPKRLCKGQGPAPLD